MKRPVGAMAMQIDRQDLGGGGAKSSLVPRLIKQTDRTVGASSATIIWEKGLTERHSDK